MEPALPLKSVVLFIACGTMVFIIVFIFAKRQITRFALKTRGPHVLIGSDAPKALRQEIERRLHRVGDIRFEPKLMPDSLERIVGHSDFNPDDLHFVYRMKAMDALVILDEELTHYSVHIRRQLGQHTLRSFLLEQRQGGPLEGLKVDVIEKFTDAYDMARHDPSEFMRPQYVEYMNILNQLIDHIRTRKKQRDNPVGTSTSADVKTTPSQAPNIMDQDISQSEQQAPPHMDKVINVTHGELTPQVVHDEGTGVSIAPVTYRPHASPAGQGSLAMLPGSSGSSQVDVASTGLQSDASSRSSGHFETSV